MSKVSEEKQANFSTYEPKWSGGRFIPDAPLTEHVDALFLEQLLRLLLAHGLNLHGPAGVLFPVDSLDQILGRVIGRDGGGLFRGEGLDSLVREQVELGVNPLAFLVDEFQGVSVVPVHVSVTIGDTSITEQDHDLGGGAGAWVSGRVLFLSSIASSGLT